jgi:hypothetical protein
VRVVCRSHALTGTPPARSYEKHNAQAQEV